MKIAPSSLLAVVVVVRSRETGWEPKSNISGQRFWGRNNEVIGKSKPDGKFEKESRAEGRFAGCDTIS